MKPSTVFNLIVLLHLIAAVFDLFVYLIRISCGLADKLMVNSLFYATKRLVALCSTP